MSRPIIEADYLVVGAGAAGMAFVDTLVAETDARVVMVDRRAAPGGHWNEAYPFVRLHQPSRYYGVTSMPLGGEALQTSGPEAGLYERATGAEIRAYYQRVMDERLIASGRVRFLAEHDYLGDGRVVSRVSADSAETLEVAVRKKVVDTTYLSPAIPANTPAPFQVAGGVACVPVNALANLADAPERFAIIGGGKTAMDACGWLLENGIDPDRIQWIKPRESWLLNRRYAQPGELGGTLFEGISLQVQAAAQARSADDLFDRLEAAEQFRRVDRAVRPTMYKSATIAEWELDLLRRITDVVRLGHVRSVEPGRINLQHGTVATQPGTLHVHCAAEGLPRLPAVPIFAPGRITLQPVRVGLVPFNAALVAFIESRWHDDTEKNRLCPPNPFPDTPLDWAQGMIIQLNAERALSKEPEVVDWLERTRLNPIRGVRARFTDPQVQRASRRFADHVGPALARLAELISAT
jgi:hypothetical protein